MIRFRPDQLKWEQVLAEIRRRIRVGEYRPGYPMPGAPRLAEEFGVAKRTAERVIEELRAANEIYTVRGKGTFIADPKTGGPPEELEPSEE
ncbi:winged helix-turn-helix domain-containing protein [Microbispora rosea]|uniref:winged helix-turn-helix domain-containing protein n=1 Tax=Microbispora rosea TaxID=58117 RepID=UPI0037C9A69C